jgi:enamine deaminase RidA (YjgF/YER057c/UK114 family)
MVANALTRDTVAERQEHSCGVRKTRVFLVDAAHGVAVAHVHVHVHVHAEAFGTIRPATGVVIVQGFLDPRWLVEIEVEAVVGS